MTFIVVAAAAAGSIQAWLTAVPVTATVQYFEHSAAALTRLWVRCASLSAQAICWVGGARPEPLRDPAGPAGEVTAVSTASTTGDPILLLTGHGHWQQTGFCAVSLDFDETFTRTGD